MKISRLILLGCFISLFTHARWEEISTPSTDNLTTIEFIGNIGYCAGSNGTLLKSSNGGQTWNSITSGTTDNITSILFLDNNTGYFSTSTGYVYKTTNGGASWTNNKPQTIGAINGIDFLNNSIGLAVGDNGAIFRTSNGGTSWSSLGNFSVYVINDVEFINDTLAVAVGAQGSILASSDEGLTWNSITSTSSKTFTAIEKINDSTAAMVGSSGLYSTFNSNTMTASNEQIIDPDPTPDLLKDIHLSSSGNLYVVGYNQTVLITNPDWKKWDLDSINNLNSIHFLNDTIGFACGANGKIYKTVTGGFPLSNNELEIHTLSLYPNPATNRINFKGLRNQENQLLIYNQNGQLIINTKIFQNQYNIESLKVGLYFTKIIGAEGIYNSKFLKK